MTTKTSPRITDAEKLALVRRGLAPGSSPSTVARELGICRTSLYLWTANYKEFGSVSKKQKARRSLKAVDKRSAEEKLGLFEAWTALADEERGAFLRREGLHDADIKRWRQEMLGGFDTPAISAGDQVKTERKMKRLEAELREARALAKLQKKFNELLEAVEEGTLPE